jgi:ribose transport system ATP-binding protein
MEPAALEVEDLRKSFGGVPVLKGITFTVTPGTVTVLAGENGAGKSTLFKIITGQLRADTGSVKIRGERLLHANPGTARSLGVGIVPQELSPYADLSVYENLFVGRETRTRAGLLARGRMIQETHEILGTFGVDIDPTRRMGDLSVALTQIVEVAKATTSGAKVLLLDEPTSSIPEQEVEQLYSVVRKLRDNGVAMLYTTHRMAEMKALADRVVVLRDGGLIFDEPAADLEPTTVVNAMIGRDLNQMFPDKREPADETALQVRSLKLAHHGPANDLTVRKGEILGIGGLVGAGRSELVEAIYGVRKSVEGTINVGERSVRRGSVEHSISSGIAFVPEDRKGAGLVLSRSILDNGSLPHLSSFARAGFLNEAKRRSTVEKETASVNLRARSLDQTIGTLSGGNQQKVVIARWLAHDPKVLILDEPTRGVDVGARGEIYRIITELAAAGMGVILVSSDMPELIGLSHRVEVMRDGALVGELSPDELNDPRAQATIFHYASGELHEDLAATDAAGH